MLGDGTVREQDTFDPAKVSQFLENVTRDLQGWTVHDVSISGDEDLRRAFVKFDVNEGSYVLSGHAAVQFHVLLYYKLDHRVIECQQEISELVDRTDGQNLKVARLGDAVVEAELKAMGHDTKDLQKVFEALYTHDGVRKELYSRVRDLGGDLQDTEQQKAALLSELDSLLMETYQTSPVLIDEARLATGEEGHLLTFDIELRKGKSREGLFDVRRVPAKVTAAISARLDQVRRAIELAR